MLLPSDNNARHQGRSFNFVNNPPPAPLGPQATATWVFSGVTNDGLSSWVGNFTSQFGVPYQTALGNLQTSGLVTSSYSATITVTQNTQVPEPGTVSMLGLGLAFLPVLRTKLRERNTKKSVLAIRPSLKRVIRRRGSSEKQIPYLPNQSLATRSRTGLESAPRSILGFGNSAGCHPV